MDKDTRHTRYAGRHHLRSVTTIPRCFDCGRKTVSQGGAVGVRLTDEGVAGFAGLSTCGRIWLCPVCNAKVMARRALELGLALTWAQANGMRLLWGSLTCAHSFEDSLQGLLDVQRDAWRHVMNSKMWRAAGTTGTASHVHVEPTWAGGKVVRPGCDVACERKRDTIDRGGVGRVGYVRAAELTIGPNGWHPHFHPMIFWRGSAADAAVFAREVVSTWVDGVERAGGTAGRGGAQQLRVLDAEAYSRELSGYVTKATYEHAAMALEVVWSQGKTGKGRYGRRRALGTVAHWSLLAEVGKGLADAAGWWGELEEATRGHRMLMWSRGLRDFAGIGAERDDEEIAAEEVGTREDTVCFITADGWARIRDTPAAVAGILSTLEESGWTGLRAYLDAWGVEYFTLSGAPV